MNRLLYVDVYPTFEPFSHADHHTSQTPRESITEHFQGAIRSERMADKVDKVLRP